MKTVKIICLEVYNVHACYFSKKVYFVLLLLPLLMMPLGRVSRLPLIWDLCFFSMLHSATFALSVHSNLLTTAGRREKYLSSLCIAFTIVLRDVVMFLGIAIITNILISNMPSGWLYSELEPIPYSILSFYAISMSISAGLLARMTSNCYENSKLVLLIAGILALLWVFIVGVLTDFSFSLNIGIYVISMTIIVLLYIAALKVYCDKHLLVLRDRDNKTTSE